jgi:holo-[acyl-carrier protein] synthase
MIHGIGTDLVEVARIEAALGRHGDRFAERVLGDREIAQWRHRSRLNRARGLLFVATRFAAKEAISKALGLGMRAPMTWRGVEIVNAPSGRPQALPHGALAAFMAARDLTVHVSLTDERGIAMAFAVAVTGDDAGHAGTLLPGAGAPV